MAENNPHPPATIRPGALFVISAPSGAGKTTLVQALRQRLSGLIVSISHTTRPRRPGEEDGMAYYFIDEAEFKRMIATDTLLEHAVVFDHHYGTSRAFVERHVESGNDVLLEIDWQGARQIKQHRPDAVSLYILPPSYLILEERLRARGDSPANIQRRMRGAYVELSHYDEYDYLVVNENLDRAVDEIEAVITSARNNYRLHRPYYDGLIKQLLEAAAIIQ